MSAADADFNGRWVIEPHDRSLTNGRVAWLEIRGAGTGSVEGSAVGLAPGGQLDTISSPRILHGELTFAIDGSRPAPGGGRRAVRTPTSVRLMAGQLHGVTEREAGRIEWIGRPAPVIDEHDDGSWKPAEPVTLFDGKQEDLERWQTLRPERLATDWQVVDGLLVNAKGADLLLTKQEFWNFDLHVEFRLGEGSNSGVALRNRYEVQIVDDYGKPADSHGNGALYSRIAPSKNASRKPGEWQTYDIRLVGRDLTVVLNGEKVLDKVTAEGITAMAADWRESEPGPLVLQGDHGRVEFRKIVLTPLTR